MTGVKAPRPCVMRASAVMREVHDVSVDAAALRFCTGDDCWSMDPVSRSVANLATPPAQRAAPTAAPARATAEMTAATFCPSDRDSCKTFNYKFAFEPGMLEATINEQGTLGAVMYAGIPEAGDPAYVLLFDLVKGKQITRVKGFHALALGTSFVIDETLYSAKGRRLGNLGLQTHGDPIQIGTTNLLAIGDPESAQLVLQDLRTAKVRRRIKLGIAAKLARDYTLVSSPDGTQLHVIAGFPFEGEVITIDVATGKQLARTAPPVCSPGTERP